MTRRDLLRTTLTTAATLAGALPSAITAQQRRPPNVIIVITDDQGYGDLGCHGNPVLKTPNLDALHARSVRFTNFHVSPTCAPTRSALMTGRYNNATGVWHTIMGRSLLAPGEVTMADCFRASGYRTGMFGKWHLGDNYPNRPHDRGFNEALYHGGGGVWQAPDHFGNDYEDDVYLRNGKPEPQKGYCTDVWFREAMRFIEGAGTRPFFCYIATNAPHGPMWAKAADEAPYVGVKGLREPGFYGMIANVDENMGRLSQFLKQRGLEENTLFVYMTDNGTSSGAQVHNSGMRGAKGSPYEGGHRVPLFVHWPEAGITGGRDVSTLTAHIDLLPTMIDYCGLKRPNLGESLPMHGRSLRPLLEKKATAWPDRTLVVDSQRLEKLVPWRQAAVMTEQWRLVNASADGDPSKLELFDIRKDPGQKQNVAAQHPEVVAKLKQAYDAWWKETSKRGEQHVRILLGADEISGPVRLSSHDWHGEGGAEKVWNQRHVRQGPVANGFWAVEVTRPGLYRIALRRWPEEVDLPMVAGYQDRKPNRETLPGKALPLVKARVKIGNVEKSVAIKPADKAAVLEVRLPAGPAEMWSWMYGSDGSERGAYYATVERVGS